MHSTKARFGLEHNEVVRRLKAGNGKVAGIKCLVAVDDDALFPVEVVGIDFYNRCKYGGGSITVAVKPIGGHGLIYVSPGELLDDSKEAKDEFERKCKASQKIRDVKNAKNDRQRRSICVDMRTAMNAKQRKLFDANLPDRIGNKASDDPVKAINSCNGEYELERIAELAASILFDLDSAPTDDDE